MASLIHADMFFFITTIAVIIISLLFAIALFFIVLILRDLRHLSGLAVKGGDQLADDLDDLRDAAIGEGARIRSIFDLFLGLFVRRRKRKANKKNS